MDWRVCILPASSLEQCAVVSRRVGRPRTTGKPSNGTENKKALQMMGHSKKEKEGRDAEENQSYR
jgi:hypothetical protein